MEKSDTKCNAVEPRYNDPLWDQHHMVVITKGRCYELKKKNKKIEQRNDATVHT